MGGAFNYYFDAAQALWEMPSEELYSLARGGQTDPMHRAAELTLRLKAEFVTPESYRDERSALTRLASTLSADPDFPIDLAVMLGRGRSATAPPSEDIRWVTRRSRRSTVLWVAVVAAVSLLVLDILATAGAPVPTPIGDLLDRITGEDVAPQTPAPPPSSSDTGTDIGLLTAAPFDNQDVLARRRSTTPVKATVDKNPHHQNGKKRNYQNGKDRNYQSGRPRSSESGRPAKATKARAHALSRGSQARETARSTAGRARREG